MSDEQLELTSEQPPEKKTVYDESELKSALQKYIRRGEVKEAVSVGKILYELNAVELLRRLPIIAVEDVGWKSVADTVQICQRTDWIIREIKKLKKEDQNEKTDEKVNGLEKELVRKGKSISRLIEQLAVVPKDKDAGWVWNKSQLKRNEITGGVNYVEWWKESLIEACNSRNEVEAAARAVPAMEKHGTDDVMDVLQDLATERTIRCIRAVDAIRYRMAIGCSSGDKEILMLGAVLAVCRSDRTAVEAVDMEGKLAWYGFDNHTSSGRIIQSIVAKKLGIDSGRLKILQFFLEGAKIHPVSNEQRHYDDAMRFLLGEKLKFEDKSPDEVVEQAKKDWEKIRPVAESLTNWFLKKNGKTTE